MNGKLFAATCLMATSAFSGTYYWKPTTAGGTYADGANWTSGAAPAAGNTYCVTNGVTNPFATGTTGIVGTLDLGGSTQTFSADPDLVFANNATVVNGTLKLTSTAQWSGENKTVTFGKDLVMTCAAYLYNKSVDGTSTLNFKDGCVSTFTRTDEQLLGHFTDSGKSAHYKVNIASGAKVSFSGTVRIGCGTRGNATVTVDNGTLSMPSYDIHLAYRASGDNNGNGTLTVKNGGYVECANITIAKATGYKSGNGKITVTDSTLKTGQIYLYTTSNSNKGSCTFNNATLIPARGNTSIFRNISPSISGGTLTVETSATQAPVKIDTVLSGAGGFVKAGTGSPVVFTVAQTYTGDTTVEAGVLTNILSSVAKSPMLTVKDGATFAYTQDISLKSATFERGAILPIDVGSVEGEVKATTITASGAIDLDGANLVPTGLDDWTDVEVIVMTATNGISGTPVLPEGLTYDIVARGEGVTTLAILDANMTPEHKKPYFARWTGAGEDPSDYSNPTNWICYNANQEVVADAVPRFYTTVLVEGETSFTYPASAAQDFPLAGLRVTGDVTLTGNCDWRAFGAFEYPKNCVIDLNGKKLDAEIPADGSLSVVGGGQVTVDVPAGATYDAAKVFGSSTCGFAKKGAGELVIHVTNTAQSVGRPLSIAAGTVTLLNESGVALTNCFATGTTGIAGTLDLGGTVQTFTEDIDDVFASGSTVKNGYYKLTNKGDWNSRGYSFTIDGGAKVDVTGRLYLTSKDKGGDFTLYVKNGSELNLLSSDDNQIGRYKNNEAKVYVQDGSRLTAKTLRVGWDTNGDGYLYIQRSSEVVCSTYLKLGGAASGGETGHGEVQVLTGSRLVANGGIYYGYQAPKNQAQEMTFSGDSVVRAKFISGYKEQNNISFNFNGTTFVPNTAGVNLFDDSLAKTKPAFHITGNMLTVSNTVGKVTVGSVLDGKGGFRLTGGEDLAFTAAPTYTGATVVEAGALTYTGDMTTALAVSNGATFAYTKDLAFASGKFALERGATLSMDVESVEGTIKAATIMVTEAGDVNLDGVNLAPTGLEDWTDVEVAVLVTTNAITGTPVLPEGLKYDIETKGGTNTLSVLDANMTPAAKRPVWAEFTGAGTNRLDLADPANWTCHNGDGDVVAGAVPRYYTVVRLQGATNFTYPAAVAEAFPLAGLELAGSVMLADDCDWRRFGAFAYCENCQIDLNGHVLDAVIPADGSLTVTGGGQVVVDVPSGTYDTAAAFGASTCGFAKKGAGELVVRVKDAAQSVGRPLSIAAGKVRLVNESGAALTNCFAVGTTDLNGTLDLGGTVQTFSADPDDIFGNGAQVVNGELALTSENEWSGQDKTVSFGTNLVMTCGAYLRNNCTGTSTLNFKDGCVCTFTTKGDQYMGYYVGSGSNHFQLNVTAGARVNFSWNVRIGSGTRGKATVTVDNAVLYTPKKIQLANRASGDCNGDGYLIVRNGGYVECSDVTIAESDKKEGYGSLSVANATLKTGQIYFVHTEKDNKASCTFNNATLVAARKDTSIFRDISPEITGGKLTIDTSVGAVTVDKALTGKGALEVTGGGTLTFTVAPTYTGATTVTDGTLGMSGIAHGSTALAVAEKGVYATDVSDATWKKITFADGAKILRSTKDNIDLTATAITGMPKVAGPHLFAVERREGEGSVTLAIRLSGFMLYFE